MDIAHNATWDMIDEKAEAKGLFVAGFNGVAAQIEAWADEKGWNSDDPLTMKELYEYLTEAEIKTWVVNYDIAKLGLMVTEIAEAIEGRRKGDPESDKIKGFTQQEEELADCIVRIMHHAAHRKLRVAEALVTKLAYNDKRPYKHGKLA